MSQRIKAILAGSSGNLVEWYDFYVYSAFSLYFAKSFFPEGDQTAQLLASAGVFAVGYSDAAARSLVLRPPRRPQGTPAGAHLSVLLMCLGSALIAVTPTLCRASASRRRPSCCSRD